MSIQVDGAKIEFEEDDDLATTAQKIAAIVFSINSDRACPSRCHLLVHDNGSELLIDKTTFIFVMDTRMLMGQQQRKK